MRVATIVVVMAGMSWGQVSIEEAQRRLEERRATATTQPNIADQLRAQVVVLQREVEKLRAENVDLSARLEKLTPPTTQQAIADAISERRLVPGMTLEEARKAMHQDGYLIEEGIGYQVYRWPKHAVIADDTPIAGFERPPRQTLIRFVYGKFEGGKLVRIADVNG